MMVGLALKLGGLVRANWKLISAVLAVTAVAFFIWRVMDGAFDRKYEAGRAAGAASIQAKLDQARGELATCQGNQTRLEGEVADTNKRIKAMSEQSAAALAQTQRQLDALEDAKAASDARIRLLSAPLKGATVCERILDSDARFLGTLK